jgi:ribosomal-protein-alanine N-acetyltransferase
MAVVGTPVTRLVTREDAEALAMLVRSNRRFFAPWDPIRAEEFFTVDGQVASIEDALAQHDQGTGLPHVIVDESGEVVGRITLHGLSRGAFQSCAVGYFVGERHNGRGLATAAVGEMKRIAFDELALHRIEAGTLPHNTASQVVLARNGFVRYGLAPQYMSIAGRWQDHVLFQVLNPA